ncbi:pantoate--beta-alanine ligase [Candidatus Thioglobus sp.]|jgi:pantoate--beta-alanine ligase|uniref:pantoate--beta-alanine ligase n=1 Tax=Candidatus Thioglobus sp. TaxID=2026721 RepID=UPI0001BD368A|nr:pantoate--beta-alanine ligase [Candidatus Thioglobus sp.]EEZ80369.1 MAG: panthothenate synthetase [uncultured Candidatus Thioglobus sp.]
MMQVFNTITALQNTLDDWRAKDRTIAFVPTMGGLHDGHLALVKLAKQKADKVVVSIFVNPTQFSENEDFDQYPNTFEQDVLLLERNQVDGLFSPSVEQIYPQGLDADIDIGEIGNILCGASRPGHFQGVVQVVNRLFDIVKPNLAVFGKKDYQQLLIIKQMVAQLSLDVKIISHSIVREKDGLAMSTRNQYLSADERKVSPNLYRNLLELKREIQKGQAINVAVKQARMQIEKNFKLDYIETLDANTLKQITDNTSEIAILCAIFIGSTRLIDNVIFRR